MTLKTLAKYIIYFSPEPIKKRLKAKVEKRRLAEGLARYKRCKVSKEEVEAVLAKLDWNHDIMLHTSTINIGHIAGGPKWLAQTIVDHCDLDNHTLVVSALPYFGAFSDYLYDGMTFDVHTAPIAMGVINEKIAKMPGVKRSAHPTHSVMALGKNSEEYTSKHHLDKTPFGPNSPYNMLIKRNARIILFGATLNNITFIHAIEDALGNNYPIKKLYSKHIYSVNCTTENGETVKVETPVHHPLTSSRRDSSFLEQDGIENGYIVRYPLGEGYIYEINARALSDRYLELLKHGKSIYGRCRKLPIGSKLILQ